MLVAEISHPGPQDPVEQEWMGLLLRELAHRLRGPLATAHGYASLLEAHLGSHEESLRCVSWAGEIRGEIECISDLLADLARIRTLTHQTLQIDACDVADLVWAAAWAVERDLGRKIEVSVEAHVDCSVDRLVTERLLYHLLCAALQEGSRARIVLGGAPNQPVKIVVSWEPGTARPQNDPWADLFCQRAATAQGWRLVCADGSFELSPLGSIDSQV